MKRILRDAVVICSTILAAAWAGAEAVRVDFPLEGYYRAGRYVPVEVSVRMEGERGIGAVSISADGAVTTTLPLVDGRAEAVVPLLMLSATAREVEVRVAGESAGSFEGLRPLGPRERLIGMTFEAEHIAGALFADHAVIPIRVDVSRLLGWGGTAPAWAWETLDAAVLDEASARRLSETDMLRLIAAGTVLAVRSEQRPPGALPWERMDREVTGLDETVWVLRHESAGPAATASFNEAAYGPILGWRPERPAGYRHRIVLFGVLFSLGMGLLALWRPRGVALGLVGLSVATIAALGWWRERQSPLVQTVGAVEVRQRAEEQRRQGDEGMLVQHDRWYYQASVEPMRSGFAWTELTRPIAAGRRHLDDLEMTLACRADGTPVSFVYGLPGQMRMAFVVRSLRIEHEEPALELPVTSPLMELVRQVYLRPGRRVAGERPGESADELTRVWPTVVIERGAGR